MWEADGGVMSEMMTTAKCRRRALSSLAFSEMLQITATVEHYNFKLEYKVYLVQ